MPLISVSRLTKALAKDRRGGVFFLFGDEEYLKDEVVSAITSAHLDPATRDFNYDQLRGSDVEPERLASIAHTPPLMAEWRVVIVREAQALAMNTRARAAVETLLDRTLPGLVLVLVATLPAGSKAQFYERLKRDAVAVELTAPSSNDLPGWLIERARAHDLDLQPDAARALAAAKGAQLGVLVQELGKLADYLADRRVVTREDIEAVVGVVPRQTRWDWFDLVGGAEFRAARAGLPVLLDAGETGVGLVIGLGTQFLRLGIAAAAGERALAQALPPHQRFLAARITSQARRWSTAGVEDALEDLLRADRLLKSASLGDRQVMEELLLRLQHRAERKVA